MGQNINIWPGVQLVSAHRKMVSICCCLIRKFQIAALTFLLTWYLTGDPEAAVLSHTSFDKMTATVSTVDINLCLQASAHCLVRIL